MSNKKSGGRTLLLSVIMSSPGPLAVGLGMLIGHSVTQVADFVRRSAELLAIIIAFVIYRMTVGEINEDRKAKLERQSNILVGAMMCIAGTIMLAIAILSSDNEKGNVIPALCIGILSLSGNTFFLIKYTNLNKKEPNAIIGVQIRLYRAKILVDSCVILALISVTASPDSIFSFYVDFVGSIGVAIYLFWSGARTIRERLTASTVEEAINE